MKKTWIVTGCSSGIGYELSQQLVPKGYNIACFTRSKDKLKEKMGEISEYLYIQEVDLSDKDLVDASVKNVFEHFGKIDVVVNNAGYEQIGFIENLNIELFKKELDINLFGYFRMMQAVLPYMKKENSGQFINITSECGICYSWPGSGAYNVSKAAADALSKTLYSEENINGIKSTSLILGQFNTDYFENVKYENIQDDRMVKKIDGISKMNHHQKGDVEKLCNKIIEISEMEIPPVEIYFGNDAYGMAYNKAVNMICNLKRWEDFSRDMDYGSERKRDNIYKRQHPDLMGEAFLQRKYFQTFNKYLDFDNPMTYNEIINWELLYDFDERKIRLSDKYLVREWIREKIGAEYLVKLYGVWDDAEDIDFDLLPKKYVLKLNHGCGWNIIVSDPMGHDKNEIVSQLNGWKKEDFSKVGYEYQYRGIKPKIICEEYLENTNGNLYDYKVFCFNGKAKYIMFLTDRNSGGLKMAFYDTDWNKQDFVYSYPMYQGEVEKPKNLEVMIKLSEKLAAKFKHVRVDWYNLPGDVLKFGEMTFSSCAGRAKWSQEYVDKMFGDLVRGEG